MRYSGALNTNTVARFRNHVRRNDASVRDRGKSASRAKQWKIITSVGKKIGMDDLSDATEFVTIPVYVLFFLIDRLTLEKSLSANFAKMILSSLYLIILLHMS